MTEDNYKELLTLAVQISLEAGMLAEEYFYRKDKNVKWKRDFSPVTEADKHIGALIAQRLSDTEINVIQEEGKIQNFEIRKKWDSLWMVDPIDGTKEFIEKRSDFTVNIALIVKNKVKLGVIYAPITQTLYYGIVKKGAFKHSIQNHQIDNKELFQEKNRISASANSEILQLLVSRSHLNSKTKKFIRKLKKNNIQIEVHKRGSSIKFCLMAEGQTSVYPRFSEIKEWDIAAGHAIAEAAGCFVSQIDGYSTILYNTKTLKTPKYIVTNSESTAKKCLTI